MWGCAWSRHDFRGRNQSFMRICTTYMLCFGVQEQVILKEIVKVNVEASWIWIYLRFALHNLKRGCMRSYQVRNVVKKNWKCRRKRISQWNVEYVGRLRSLGREECWYIFLHVCSTKPNFVLKNVSIGTAWRIGDVFISGKVRKDGHLIYALLLSPYWLVSTRLVIALMTLRLLTGPSTKGRYPFRVKPDGCVRNLTWSMHMQRSTEEWKEVKM